MFVQFFVLSLKKNYACFCLKFAHVDVGESWVDLLIEEFKGDGRGTETSSFNFLKVLLVICFRVFFDISMMVVKEFRGVCLMHIASTSNLLIDCQVSDTSAIKMEEEKSPIHLVFCESGWIFQGIVLIRRDVHFIRNDLDFILFLFWNDLVTRE